MNKSDLAAKLAREYPHLKTRDVDRALSATLAAIVEALSRRNRVELRGFGVFFVRGRAARVGRNPRNGASVEVNAKSIPAFKASKRLQERLGPTPPHGLT